LHAMLVCIVARASIREPFVGHRPAPCVASEAQNLCASTHLPVGCVVKNVALKSTRRLLTKTRLAKTHHQFADVLNPEFDLRFDSHGKQRVYAGGGKAFKRRQWECEDAAL